jgi:hypothetical protein
MNSLMRNVTVAALGAVAIMTGAHVASATEPGEGIQYAIGAGVGGVQGLAPPPGFSTFFGGTYNAANSVDGSGHQGLPKSTNYATYAGLLYNPKIKLLGADYYAEISAAVLDVTLTFGGGSSYRGTGLTSVQVKPIGLSWNLVPDHLWVETGLSAYVPVGQYSDKSELVMGNNFWTVEPDFGITYLNDGWNISGDIIYDFNTVNPTTNYTSGQTITTEFTVGKTIGKWSFGGGGYFWAQTTNDHNGGVPAGTIDAAVVGSGINPNGQDLGIGPFVNYDFGPISLTAKYLVDVYARNTTTAGTGMGSHATIGFFLPL